MYKALTSLSGGVQPGDTMDTSKMDAQNVARLVSIGAIERVDGQPVTAVPVDTDDLSHLDDGDDSSQPDQTQAQSVFVQPQRGRPRK